MKKKLILLILFLGMGSTVLATHINGGFLTYRELSANNYEIKLVVYRDCFNGVPPFDDPASIGIFDANNSLYTEILTSSMDSDYIIPNTGCLPPGICFVRCVYTEIISLPPSSGTYTLCYQRCCRPQTIINLDSPLSRGMSFTCQINTNITNTSCSFMGEIPGYAFVNDNFIFDASATDPDGDSLAYELIDCMDGADQLAPMPQPPFSPPYSNVPWLSPFSLQDVLTGPVPLTIDPVTGAMSATPGAIGTFEIAMVAKEYRNGNLINSQSREFLLFVSPANYFQFSGIVNANNGAQLLDSGKAWLVRKNMYDSTLYAVDTNMISNGSYIFPSPINGFYLMKASADSTSAFYPNNMPTYYGDQLFWYNATEVNLCSGNAANIDINLIPGVNPGGPGFVGGYISQGANRMTTVGDPLGGITVFLLDINYNPVAFGITDVNGFFSIGNLPYGTYKVLIDKLNFINHPTNYPVLNINSSNTILNNLDFQLHSDYLELVGTTGNTDFNIEQNNPVIQPNPFDKSSVLKYNVNADAPVEIGLFDVTGRGVFYKQYGIQKKGIHEIRLDEFDRAGNAVYILSLNIGNQKYNLKLVSAE